MKFRATNSASRPSINITPLLDVVFILLIFFAVSTSFMTVGAIQVDLPEADSAMEDRRAEVVRVVITKENQYYVNDNPVTDGELPGTLQRIYSEFPGASLVIEADKGSLHGMVVRVIDLGKTAGFQSFAIATDEPER